MDRDDLVFRQGTLHLFSFVKDFQIVSFDPNSCRLAVAVADDTEFAAPPASSLGRAAPALVGSTAEARRNATPTADAL